MAVRPFPVNFMQIPTVCFLLINHGIKRMSSLDKALLLTAVRMNGVDNGRAVLSCEGWVQSQHDVYYRLHGRELKYLLKKLGLRVHVSWSLLKQSNRLLEPEDMLVNLIQSLFFFFNSKIFSFIFVLFY